MPLGELSVDNHLERAEIRRRSLNQPAAARTFGGIRVVSQRAAVPEAGGRLQ